VAHETVSNISICYNDSCPDYNELELSRFMSHEPWQRGIKAMDINFGKVFITTILADQITVHK